LPQLGKHSSHHRTKQIVLHIKIWQKKERHEENGKTGKTEKSYKKNSRV